MATGMARTVMLVSFLRRIASFANDIFVANGSYVN